MMRKASETLLAHIRRSEGLRLAAYRDTAGVWTIGYGHAKGVRRGDRIGRATAEAYLLRDLLPIEKFLNSVTQVRTQGQFDALADFAYNLGLGNLKSSTLFKYVKAGKPDKDIQAQFRRWVYAGGKRLDGLVRRREWEAQRYVE